MSRTFSTIYAMSKKMLNFYQWLINVKVLLKAVETYTHKDAYYFFLHALIHRWRVVSWDKFQWFVNVEISIFLKINKFECACRHRILYPWRLELSFPNNGSALKLKVSLGPNLVKIDLRKVFLENITYFWKNKTIFGKKKEWPQETLIVCMHTHICVRMLTTCARMYRHTYVARVPKTM